MNLWGRTKRWTLILTGFIFLACEDPGEIGAELNPNNDNFTTLFKEFVLPTSVVFTDSVTTDFPPELLVGIYDDPNFGKTKVISYTQIGGVETLNGFQFPVSPDAIYDSAKLFLKLKYFVGEDFTQPQKLFIHTLRDTLFRNVLYKSTIRTPISRDPVAELEFNATAGLDTSLVVNINEEFGRELLALTFFEQIVDPRGDSRASVNVIPGLAFVPGEDNNYILAIEDNISAAQDEIVAEEFSVLRVFYHLEGETPRSYDFAIGNSAIQHINVETDRSASALSGIQAPFEEFEPSTGLRYVQPLTGINTKVDMSEVWNFIDSIDGFVVNNAQFEISEVIDVGGAEDFITTVANLSLVFVNDNNKVVSNGELIGEPGTNINLVVLDDGSYNSSATSNPLRIDYEIENALFSAEISNYIQAVADSALGQRDLMIFPLVRNSNPNIGQIRAIDQLIFDPNSIKLRIFYSTIQ